MAKGFEKHADFHNSIGAIDGKRIRRVQPKGTGSLYYCYKSFLSRVLLVPIIHLFTWILVHMEKAVIQQFLPSSCFTKRFWKIRWMYLIQNLFPLLRQYATLM